MSLQAPIRNLLFMPIGMCVRHHTRGQEDYVRLLQRTFCSANFHLQEVLRFAMTVRFLLSRSADDRQISPFTCLPAGRVEMTALMGRQFPYYHWHLI
jgi:hypothetical protein